MTKRNVKEFKEEEYKYQAAGKTWVFQEITFLENTKTREITLPAKEIKKMNKSVCNEICGSEDPLNWEEFQFLCESSGTRFKEISDQLGGSKSTVSKWKSKASKDPHFELDKATSFYLKLYFWDKIFKLANSRPSEQLRKLKKIAEASDDTTPLKRAS